MGINKQTLKFLLLENEYKPLYGRILLIGRSTVSVDSDTLSQLFERFNLQPPQYTLNERVTKHQSDRFNLDDTILFSSFSDEIESVDVLDVSAYEGANLIVDLNHPIPEELYSKYDFIFDSSVIDNIFNPAEAIKNIALMLKPSGRYVGINVNSFYPGAMVSCPPEWFYSFFAVNDFKDVKVYLMEQQSPGISRFEYSTSLYRYQPTFTPDPKYDRFQAVKTSNHVYHSLVVAEQTDTPSATLQFPINLQYLESSTSEDWTSKRFSQTSRPNISADDNRVFDSDDKGSSLSQLPLLTDHYIPINVGF